MVARILAPRSIGRRAGRAAARIALNF